MIHYKNILCLLLYGLNWSITIFFALIYYVRLPDITYTNYFSLYFSLINIIIIQFQCGAGEICAIDTAKLLKSDDSSTMLLHDEFNYINIEKAFHRFLKILYNSLLIFIIYLIILLNLKSLLSLFNFKTDICVNVSLIINYSIPFIILFIINKCIEGLLISLNQKEQMMKSYLLSYIIFGVIIHILFNNGVYLLVFPIAKFIQEALLLVMNIYLLNKKINITRLLFPDFSYLVKDNLNTFIYLFKILVSIVGEIISYEALTLLLGRYGKETSFIAWTNFINFMSNTYLVSSSVTNEIRDTVSKLIGQKKYCQARSFSHYIYKMMFTIGIFVGILFYIFAKNIAMFYNINYEIYTKLTILLKMYSLILPLDFCLSLMVCFIKIIKQEKFLVLGNLVIFPILSMVLGITLIKVYLIDMKGAIISLYFSYIITYVALFYGFYTGKWDNTDFYN